MSTRIVLMLCAGAVGLLTWQTLAPLDLPAVLLAALVPRPAWVLALLAALCSLVGLIARRAAARRGKRGTVALAAALVVWASAVAIVALWQGRLPYRRTAVSMVAADGIRLAATLYQPDVAGPRPAVVLAPGSAAAPRQAYGYVADRLCRAGFAVLVADKRGIGGSEGGYDRENNSSRSTLELLGNDLGAWLDWLVRQPGIDPRRTGFWGVSQAGWTVSIALSRSPGARFAVLMSGPTVSTGEENAFSELAGEDGDHFAAREPIVPFDEIDRRMVALSPSGFDPRPYLERIDVPMLFVYGEWDNSIPVRRSVARIEDLRRRGKPFASVVLPEANHLLMIARGPHRALLPAFAPGAWTTMLDWMRRVDANLSAR